MNEQMLPRHIENKKRLGGRPRVSKEAKRGRRVQIYMDEETYQILQIQCQKTRLSMSSLLLQNAKGIEIKERLPKEFSKYIRLFAGVANNLNQLTHLAHLHGYSVVKNEIEQLLPAIGVVLERLSHI